MARRSLGTPDPTEECGAPRRSLTWGFGQTPGCLRLVNLLAAMHTEITRRGYNIFATILSTFPNENTTVSDVDYVWEGEYRT